MTPAIHAARQAKIPISVHEYRHDPATTAFGEEVVQALGVPPGQVFKTLVVSLDGDDRRLAVGILPVNRQLDLKAIAAALQARKAALADPKAAERATGYVVGGISPLAQRKRLPTVLDTSAGEWPTIYVSAGRRGLQIQLAPTDLAALTAAARAPIARAD